MATLPMAKLPGQKAASKAKQPSAGADAGDERLKELERQLRQAERERDDLARDVEALCMNNGDESVFSSSTVLSLRIRNTDRELSESQDQLASAQADSASLREDNRALRESKRVADTSWREERGRREALEKELAFYQQQSARAMGDRDRAVWEAEELRRQNMTLEEDARRLEGKRMEEASKRQAAEAMLAACREEVVDLQRKVAEAEDLPELRRQLQEAQGERDELRLRLDESQAALAQAEEQLAASRQETQEAQQRAEVQRREAEEAADGYREAAAALEAERDAAKAQLLSLEQAHALLSASAEEQDAGLAAAQAELEVLRRQTERELETERRQISGEVDRLDAHRREQVAALERQLVEEGVRLAEARAQLEDLTGQKVAALIKLSEEQGRASAAEEELAEMKREVDGLKQRLHKATLATAASQAAAAGRPKPARQAGLFSSGR